MSSALSSRLAQFVTRLINACSETHQALIGDHAQLLSDGNYDNSDVSSAYAKPFLVLDLVWNIAFVLVVAGVLLNTSAEHPSTPLRVWLCGYAFQCIFHMGFLYLEYRENSLDSQPAQSGHSSSQNPSRNVEKLESVYIVISAIWWVLGFYWIVMGGQALLQDCPRLYWSTVVFLAFEAFLIVLCTVIAFIGLFCIAPVLLFVALTNGGGASEKEISSLPKYVFRHSNMLLMSADTKKHPNNLSLHLEDFDCCICLCQYADGEELYHLPCKHLFHCGCISRWLCINATCPLCKANILRGETLV